MGFQYFRILGIGAMGLAVGGAGCLLPDYTGADGVCEQGTPWTRQMGGSLVDVAFAAGSDPCGGVTMGGGVQGTVTFGPGVTVEADNKDLDGFITRLDARGNALWATSIGSSGQQVVSHVETDFFGNAVAAGAFVGTLAPSGGPAITGEGDPNVSSGVMPGEKDAREYSTFVTKLDLLGAHLWTRALLGPTDMTSTTPCGVAVDRDGNVTIAGNFKGQVTIEGSTLGGDGDPSIFVVQYDEAGALRWNTIYSTAAGAECNAFTADNDGNLLMTGAYRSAIDFGDGPLPAPNTDGQRFFVVKLTPDGKIAWSDASTTGDGQGGSAITSDAQGNVFVAGSFLGFVNLGQGDVISKGVLDLFVQKRNSAGEIQWGKVFASAEGGLTVATVATLRADPAGNVLLGGAIVGDLVLDKQLVANVGEPAMTDAFLARLSGSNGAPLASRIFLGPGSQALSGLAVDLEGWPIVVSWFSSSLDLGAGPGALKADDFDLGTIFAAKFEL
jgi:hypothetical protein